MFQNSQVYNFQLNKYVLLYETKIKMLFPQVPKNVSTNTLKLQILPCGGTITTKIFQQKILQNSYKIHRSTMLAFTTVPGDRFLIKIASTDSFSNRRTRQIGVGVIYISLFTRNNTLIYQHYNIFLFFFLLFFR